MQFSKKWLNEFVDKDLNEIKLSEILTQGGLEVEEVEDLSLISDLVVVGEIVGIQKHPNADRLNICQVNVGQKDDLQIVCGAPNARVGIKVPCAKVGTKYPLASKKVRTQGIVERLTAGGSGAPIAQWSDQHLERMLKTNSAFRAHADELRTAHKARRA